MATPNDSRLCRLPTEILIEIVKLLPNFSSLWALMSAFPRFEFLFLQLPFEIFDTFLEKETPPCIQALMRVALVTRISPSWFPDIKDVTKHMSRHKTFDLYFEALPQHIEEPHLTSKVAFAVRDMVEVAHKIHAVAHACLEYYVRKSMTIKPERWDASLPPFDHSQLGGQPQGLPIQPTPTGPPTYEEEQILIRLLWRLQVFTDLRAAAKQDYLRHWSVDECGKVQTWNVDWLFHYFTPKSNREELFRTYIDSWNPYCEKEQFRSLMDFIVDITAAKTEYQPGLRELEAFMKDLPVDVYESGYHVTCLPPKPILEIRRGPITIDDLLPATLSIDEMVEKPPAGWRVYHQMTTDHRYYYSGVPFEPYRKYGFAFWQAERMGNLGFKEYDGWEDDGSILRVCYFVWQSILRGVDVVSAYSYRHVVTQ
ncbi:uncharacterized protein BHQ10_004078 [Talaromyces amestolkiae]|uniref:F-box domain-containing protein n=1 Tax=Talaromyces amestolkiae TaxID=1196081 RepID=A0A364KWX9_TALAM|nr:uncharacterized protein BHQ10_004078 [Talaromyces amestolkiae]RAO68066.1 hypothetical protein BHQ10_004078 [Talaromyces amestolkiae]